MSDCDGFFEDAGIPYEAGYQDAAVRAVLSADFYDPPYKKFLITCWFDTTFGVWNGPLFNRGESPAKMTEYLRGSNFRTYEEMIKSGGRNEYDR